MKKKHKYSLDNDWPFPDPPNVAVFTTISVLNRSAPIVLITHDEEDGAWQFHSASEVGSPEDYVRIVSLQRIVELDPTVVQVADLARGWIAERLANGGGWKKYRSGIRK